MFVQAVSGVLVNQIHGIAGHPASQPPFGAVIATFGTSVPVLLTDVNFDAAFVP